MIQPTPQVEFAIAELKKAMLVFPQLSQMVYRPILDHLKTLEDEVTKIETQRGVLLGTLNAIGDLFEYRYANKTPAELKAEVLSAIDAGTARLKKTTGKLPACAI